MSMAKTAAALALGAALGLALALPATAQTVKIGVILTYSGPAASLGDQIDKGIVLKLSHMTRSPACHS